MKFPKVSIIIPVREIGHHLISENLPSIQKLKYTHFEVIILPNTKMPSHSKLETSHPWLRIVPTFDITGPAQKRNLGAKMAKGDILAFIDDDAYPKSNWLTNAVNIFMNKKVDAVCGPGVIPRGANFWEKTFDLLLTSSLGSGAYTYRFSPGHEQYVDDYPSMNFLIKKYIFNEIGGFNSNFWPGEDSKLCEELVYNKKRKILYSPDVLIYHHRRTNPLAFLIQHSQYGYHRGAFFAHGDKNSRHISYLIPSGILIYFFVFFVITFAFPKIFSDIGFIFILPILAYVLILILQTFWAIFKTDNLLLSICSSLFLVLTHLTYGIYFIKGFLSGVIKPKRHIYKMK